MFSLFVSVLLISTIIHVDGLDTSPQKMIEETTILLKTDWVFKSMNEANFNNALYSAMEFGIPFLKSTDYFSKVILSQFEGNSSEYTNMKEIFQNIILRMNNIVPEFQKVKGLINWDVVQIPYSEHELSVDVLLNLISNIVSAQPQIRPVMVNQFLISYDQIYKDTCDQLYAFFTNAIDVKTNLIEAVTQFTENHLPHIQYFFLNNINLIMKGLLVETFYMNAKFIGGVQQSWTYHWDLKLHKILGLMENTTLVIKNNWHSQLEVDLEKFSIQNHKLSNENYSEGFYNYLVDKYPWREWFVIIYNPITSSQKHFVEVWDGYIKFRLRKHNVVVGSAMKNSRHIDVATVEGVLSSIDKKFKVKKVALAESILKVAVAEALQKAGQEFVVAAVIEWGAGVFVKANNDYVVHKKYEGIKKFTLTVMG